MGKSDCVPNPADQEQISRKNSIEMINPERRFQALVIYVEYI